VVTSREEAGELDAEEGKGKSRRYWEGSTRSLWRLLRYRLIDAHNLRLISPVRHNWLGEIIVT
jgi:hypothetical protein